MTSSERQRGIVAKWLNHRGIGFVTPEGQDAEVGKDYLVHYSNIKQEPSDGFKSLAEGSAVEFETTEDPKNPDKLIAINVTGVGGGNCESFKGKRYQRASKGEEEPVAPGSQLFVGNLPSDYHWKDLKDLFKKCGDVKRADVFKKGGMGTVRMSTAEEATKAIETLNGTDVKGSSIEVRLDKKAK